MYCRFHLPAKNREMNRQLHNHDVIIGRWLHPTSVKRDLTQSLWKMVSISETSSFLYCTVILSVPQNQVLSVVQM